MTQFPTRQRRLGNRGGLTRKAFLEAVGAAAAAALWPAARPRAQEAPARDARERIARIVREISGTGVPIVLVEQNAEMALELADYAYVLETGSVTLQGNAEELHGNEHIRRAYLGG